MQVPGEVMNPFLRRGLGRRNMKKCERENTNGTITKTLLMR